MNKDLQLLYAKDAIFRMIGQFHRATKFDDDGELYMYDYCESALESAFNVLGIEEDCIKLMDFCKMREDNNRAIWSSNFPAELYRGLTAEHYYQGFKDDYESWERSFDEMLEEDD